MKRLLSGNEAVAQGAMEAGVRLAAAYPGTPSTEILETLSKFPGAYAQWSPNEKVAFEVGIGASMAGARAMVCMKHVGVNVAADPLMTFSYTGVNGGFVLVCADDPEMHSSQNEQDNRHYARFAKIPMLEPSNSQEAKDFLLEAYKISETFDTPVMLRLTTRISHSKTIVECGEWKKPEVKGFKKDVSKYVMMPVFAIERHKIVEERLERLKVYSENSPLNRIEMKSTSLGVVTSSISYQYVREVLPDASIMKVGLSWPLPIEKIRQFANSVEQLMVVEELDPFMETELKAAGINCFGKEYISLKGELNPERLEEALVAAKVFLDFSFESAPPNEVLSRPPVLCAGCPHRTVFNALKKLKANVFGDIGCYTLAALPPLGALHSCICMGASIGNAIGVDLVDGSKQPVVAVIGDSTFLHSGLTGIMDAVYNKSNVTVIILDNRATAMTGGQNHPGTGFTLMGEPTHQADIAAIVKALGVPNVVPIDATDFNKTVETIQAAIDYPGPSVLITQEPCRLFPKKRGGNPYYIDLEICNGCGICLKIGCPALFASVETTPKGLRKAEIDQIACVGCDLCAQLCPVSAIMAPIPQEAKQ
jgi:indolepyruvate ferredoxin oxidoreductase alpha subunit